MEEKSKTNTFFDDKKPEIKPIQKPKKYRLLEIFVLIIFLLILIAAGSAAIYYYIQYKKALQNPAAESKSELQSLTETIGKILELPEGEEPTLATVTDVEKIKNQPFFAKAQNGDKVLVYAKNEKAILFRPSTGRIIEISMVSGTEENAPPAEDPPVQDLPAGNDPISIESPVKVSVYNGGRINGLEQKIADKISQIAGIEIAEKSTAKGIYKNTLVVDLSGSRQELAQEIAKTVGGAVGKLPNGEVKPEADILVIGGNDFKTE